MSSISSKLFHICGIQSTQKKSLHLGTIFLNSIWHCFRGDCVRRFMTDYLKCEMCEAAIPKQKSRWRGQWCHGRYRVMYGITRASRTLIHCCLVPYIRKYRTFCRLSRLWTKAPIRPSHCFYSSTDDSVVLTSWHSLLVRTRGARNDLNALVNTPYGACTCERIPRMCVRTRTCFPYRTSMHMKAKNMHER